MKHLSFRISSTFILTSLAFLLLTPTTFAKTKGPYNALAQTLKSNTTKGVFSESDPLQHNTQVSGTIWSKNGSTFVIRLPNDDAGYNILVSAETTITKNGVTTTSKNIAKGIPVTVLGTLDTSTYTIKATSVELGKTISAAEKPVVIANKETPKPASASNSEQTKEPKTEPAPKENKHISHSLKQGSRGEEVLILQKKLAELGLLAKENATGYYGTQTTKAVKAFQKKYTLPPVGFVGPKTIELLNE